MGYSSFMFVLLLWFPLALVDGAQECGANLAGYVYTPNTDFFGGVPLSKSKSRTDLRICGRACSNSKNCKGFVFVQDKTKPVSGTCYFKKELGTAISSVTANSYIPCTPSPLSPICGARDEGFKFYPNTLFRMSNYKNTKGSTVDKCILECQLDPKCKMVAFDKIGSFCSLKKRVPEATKPYAGSDAWVKCDSGPQTFTILHYNDVHSRLQPADNSGVLCSGSLDLCYGGFGKMAATVKAARAAGPTLLLDAGDQFVGTLFSYFYRGAELPRLQNALGIDVMTLGNHEFDYGPAVLASYIKNLTFPVSTCNVVPKPNSELYGLVKPGPLVLKLKMPAGNIVKVGIVAWTVPTTAQLSSPGPNIDFLPLVSSVQACVDQLQATGINTIIGLGHAGLQDDGDTLVAASVRGIDLVIGAHSHTFLYNGTGPVLNINNLLTRDIPTFSEYTYPYPVQATYDSSVVVPYYQAYYASKYMGNISVTFDSSGNLIAKSGYPILLGGKNSENNVAPDADMDAIVNTLAAPLAAFRSTVVGTAAVFLDGVRSQVRTMETNLGNLICDALIWSLKQNPSFEATYGPVNIAFQNGGGIRSPINAGPVTVENVLAVLPFGNVLTVKKVTGVQLRSIIAASANKYNPGSPSGGFLQVAGVYYAFDTSLPVGSRLLEAKLLNPVTKCLTPIVDTDYYNVAVNDFTGNGGDDFADFKAAIPVFPSGRVMNEIVADYINATSPANPVVEGRIRNVNGAQETYTPVPICSSSQTCSLTTTSYTCAP